MKNSVRGIRRLQDFKEQTLEEFLKKNLERITEGIFGIICGEKYERIAEDLTYSFLETIRRFFIRKFWEKCLEEFQQILEIILEFFEGIAA